MTWRAFDKNRNDILDLDEYMAMSGMAKDHGRATGPMDHGDHGRGGRDGPDGKCAMTQRVRFDGSCGLCKKPYVQGEEDNSTCVFIGKRSFGRDQYFGRMQNYKQHGKGLYLWGGDENNSYYGLWLNGKKHGRGIKKFRSGATYMGGWLNNYAGGFGKYTFASGRTYEGNFRNGRFTGKGKMTWPDGTYVESNRFSDDDVSGRGRKVWADGSRYEGEFRKGWMTG